eukprot:TRINITY_DN8588_c0_g2_i2.p1 TRINITY_DN8588_c0_g2~~TRINITY_DN8588_c0_g2_i2.p1  ORF type:complete len:358 (+),score=68.83 TRINITY_DN8588_c0_g2_i2:1107-2180(+)
MTPSMMGAGRGPMGCRLASALPVPSRHGTGTRQRKQPPREPLRMRGPMPRHESAALPLSEWRAVADDALLFIPESVVRQGEAYVRHRRVSHSGTSQSSVHMTVRGSSDKLHAVTVKVPPGCKSATVESTCPCARGASCKHQAAALLQLRRLAADGEPSLPESAGSDGGEDEIDKLFFSKAEPVSQTPVHSRCDTPVQPRVVVLDDGPKLEASRAPPVRQAPSTPGWRAPRETASPPERPAPKRRRIADDDNDEWGLPCPTLLRIIKDCRADPPALSAPTRSEGCASPPKPRQRRRQPRSGRAPPGPSPSDVADEHGWVRRRGQGFVVPVRPPRVDDDTARPLQFESAIVEDAPGADL